MGLVRAFHADAVSCVHVPPYRRRQLEPIRFAAPGQGRNTGRVAPTAYGRNTGRIIPSSFSLNIR